MHLALLWKCALRSDQVAKGAKEDELKRSQDEKAAKETALEDAKAKIEHYTAVISQAQTDIGEAQTSHRVTRSCRRQLPTAD